MTAPLVLCLVWLLGALGALCLLLALPRTPPNARKSLPGVNHKRLSVDPATMKKAVSRMTLFRYIFDTSIKPEAETMPRSYVLLLSMGGTCFRWHFEASTRAAVEALRDHAATGDAGAIFAKTTNGEWIMWDCVNIRE